MSPGALPCPQCVRQAGLFPRRLAGRPRRSIGRRRVRPVSLLGREVRDLIEDFGLAHGLKLAQLRGFVSGNFVFRPLPLFR